MLTLDASDLEAAVVTISGGGVELDLDGPRRILLPGRPSVFEGMPWAAYLPPGTAARVVGRPLPGRRAVVAIAQAPSSGRDGVAPEPIVVGPDEPAID